MVNRPRVRIPAISTLIAFESAGRLGNFSRAAEELQTSQSAISRHIARLEEHLSTRMFDRSRTGVCLTEAGNHLYDAVASGLQLIDRAITEAGDAPDEEHVEVACSHDAWQLVLMPRLDAIREALDGNSVLRVLLYPHDPGGMPARSRRRCAIHLAREANRSGIPRGEGGGKTGLLVRIRQGQRRNSRPDRSADGAG